MKDVNCRPDWQSLGTSAYVWRTDRGNLHFKKTWQVGNTIGMVYGLACLTLGVIEGLTYITLKGFREPMSGPYVPVFAYGIAIVSLATWSFYSRHSIVVSKNGISIGRRKIARSEVRSIAVVARSSDAQWPVVTPMLIIKTQSGREITVFKDLLNLDDSVLAEIKNMIEAALSLDRKDSPTSGATSVSR